MHACRRRYATRGSALQACCTRHCTRHARPPHCSRLSRMSRRHSGLSSDKRATIQLLECFSQAGHADVQRVVGEEVDVGRTSPSALTCDAGTLDALSAGDLGRYRALAHLLQSCSRPRRSETCRTAPCYPLSARSRSSHLLQIRWSDDASRASSDHAPAARSGRTAATGAG